MRWRTDMQQRDAGLLPQVFYFSSCRQLPVRQALYAIGPTLRWYIRYHTLKVEKCQYPSGFFVILAERLIAALRLIYDLIFLRGGAPVFPRIGMPNRSIM